ncbi:MULTISPECIES: hypothetical protein [Geotalea]|nr:MULTISPECIES: hypothetical protein [Geotalea]
MTFEILIVYLRFVVTEKTMRHAHKNGNQKRKEVISSMKKLISLALCLALALAFAAGCKKKEEAPVEPAKTEAPAAAPVQEPMTAKSAPAAPEATPAAPAEKK